MRSLILLLLLAPSLVCAQVKILMPVVAKDASGKAITDLKASNFQVSGPKDIHLAELSLVPPQAASSEDSKTSVVMIYDAANIPTSHFELDIRDIRDFLSEVAHRKLAVTLLINTQAGLRLIYSARTSPEVLSAALLATSNAKSKPKLVDAAPTDSKVEEQVKNLKVLDTALYVRRSRLDAGLDQMNSLLALAHINQQIPGRKALIWVTMASPVSATQLPAYWGSTTTMADRSLLPMYEAMVEDLNAAHVSVYPLLCTQANPETSGVLWDEWMGLKQLAASTGGLAMRLGTQTSLLAAVDYALNDFGPYYLLVVEVPTPRELDWIPVKIKVDRPGLTVRAAPGFLALKPAKTK